MRDKMKQQVSKYQRALKIPLTCIHFGKKKKKNIIKKPLRAIKDTFCIFYNKIVQKKQRDELNKERGSV